MTTFSAFFRQLLPAVLSVVIFIIVCGLLYPIGIWVVSRIGSDAAEGSPVTDSAGCIVGSKLIGVDVSVPVGDDDPYFHSRVSTDDEAADPTAAVLAPGDPSAGLPSNAGPSNPDLADTINLRRQAIAEREGVSPDAVPVDAITGSGSGLDPHISPEYARLQIPRVARATGKSEDEIAKLVEDNTEGRQLGVLGAPRVNVLELNLALGHTAPNCATPSS